MMKLTIKTKDSRFTRIIPRVDQENIQEQNSKPSSKKSQRKRKRDQDQEFLPNKKKRGEAAILEENRRIFADKQRELLEYVEKSKFKQASKDQHPLRESSQHKENGMTSSMEISRTEKKSFGCSVADLEDKKLEEHEKMSISYQVCTKTESKPAVLRKFKPPMSRYRLKELAAEKAAAEAVALEALRASEVDRPSTPLSVATSLSTEFQNDSGFEDSPVKAQPSIKLESASEKPMTSIPTEELDDLLVELELSALLADLVKEDQQESTDDSPKLKKACKQSNTAKLHEINAWLAQKQSRWCVKDKAVLKEMLERESLVSAYKCMVKDCSFTTISTRNFTKHLDCHEAADAEKRFLFRCPYCFFQGSSSTKLLDHYKIHRFDRFQCGYCFYRSASAESCQEHIKSLHENSEIKIYECLLEAIETNTEYMERLHSKRKMFITPLHCTGKLIFSTFENIN